MKMERKLLYLDLEIPIKKNSFCTANFLLDVKGKDWQEIDSKAKKFCEENKFTLAGGWILIGLETRENKWWEVIIDIEDPDWKPKLNKTISLLLADKV